MEGVQGEVGVKTSVRRVRTFRWRQIKTIDKSSNLDRVHLTGFKAMHLLELGGFKRIKVAAAASKSSPRFDIICLSRIPLASTRQRLLRLRGGCTTQTSHLCTEDVEEALRILRS